LQFQSQWRKGKLLGSGTFGQVYLGFNRYRDFFFMSFHYLLFDYYLEFNASVPLYATKPVHKSIDT
jgi:serine/threonine protein kinase